jgi:hypothetical protein
MNWKPIKAQAIKAAEALGHKLGPFDHRTLGVGGTAKFAMCETCHGWLLGLLHAA